MHPPQENPGSATGLGKYITDEIQRGEGLLSQMYEDDVRNINIGYLIKRPFNQAKKTLKIRVLSLIHGQIGPFCNQYQIALLCKTHF